MGATTESWFYTTAPVRATTARDLRRGRDGGHDRTVELRDTRRRAVASSGHGT